VRLQRESINSNDREHDGLWYFIIVGTEEQGDRVERIEDALSLTELPCYCYANSKHYQTWGHFSDRCPVYSDGYSSGYWIPVDLVAAFKAAWKVAKKTA
jgi:hypothetical protein